MTAAPSGAVAGSPEWIRVTAPGGKAILANVIRPSGSGPWPAVVLLHGQSGFSNAYLSLGAEIAQSGFVAIVGCWFGGHYDGASTADPPAPVSIPGAIACPDGPSLKPLTSTASVDDVAALLTAARTLPGVRADRIALVGNSRGALAAVATAALSRVSAQAIVGIGGAPPGGALLALAITAPVLLIQGDADSVIPVDYAKSLEAALRGLGRTVEAHYYPNHGHGILFDTPRHAETVRHVTSFLDAYLDD